MLESYISAGLTNKQVSEVGAHIDRAHERGYSHVHLYHEQNSDAEPGYNLKITYTHSSRPPEPEPRTVYLDTIHINKLPDHVLHKVKRNIY